MKKTKEEAERTRHSILVAASELFGTRGFEGTTLVDVAKEAGLTRGAIYWHFKDKMELLNAVADWSIEKLLDEVKLIMESGVGPKNKLRRILFEQLKLILEKSEYRIFDEVIAMRYQKKVQVKRFHKKLGKIRKVFEELIIEGIESGEFNARLDPGMIFLAMISFLTGIKNIMFQDIEVISSYNNIDNLVDIFMNGITTDKNPSSHDNHQ